MDFGVCWTMLLLRAIRILVFRCSAFRVESGWAGQNGCYSTFFTIFFGLS